MSIGVVVITDGRGECFERTVSSLVAAWGDQPVDEVIIVDDSGDPEYRRWLNHRYGQYELVSHITRRGFAGAIQSAWDTIGHHDWIFHLEDDFTFNEPINCEGMIDVLDRRPDVMQMALKRQPCGSVEEADGGFMEQHPEEYVNEETDGYSWCWQRRFYTTNPSFYRGSLTKRGWPQVEHSEGMFSMALIEEDPEAKFGFWGHTSDPPRVHHIGEQRIGVGY